MSNVRQICGKRKRENQCSFKNLFLHTFKSSEPRKLTRLVLELSEPWLLEKLIFILSEKEIVNLSEEKQNEIIQSGKVWELLVELMKVQCTVGQLVNAMYMEEFLPAKMAMGIIYEKMKVHKEPGIPDEVILVLKGDEFVLEYIVSGVPFPQFKWFYNDSPIDDYFRLYIPDFRENHQGTYYCKATQFYEGVIHKESVSHRIQCRLAKEAPQFKINLPPNLRCEEGSTVELVVEMEDDTNVTYEWWCSNQIISTTSNCIKISPVTQKDKGKYRCAVSSDGYCTMSTLCDLDVIPSNALLNVNMLSAKLALLIGNNDYSCCSKLRSSINDVVCLADSLKKIGFNVMNLVDLNKDEMISAIEKFSECIKPNSYVFFYFSGHGFIHGHKFMMPTDSPPQGSFSCSDCISEHFIKGLFYKMNPVLYIEVLDMCLKHLERSENPNLFDSDGHAIIEHFNYNNSKTITVQAYPTKENQKTYESRRDKHYMSYSKCLSRHLGSDLPVTKIFLNAHEEFSENNKLQLPNFTTEAPQNAFKLNDATNRIDDIATYMDLSLKISEEYEIRLSSFSATLYTQLSRGSISNALDVEVKTIHPEVFTIHVKEINFTSVVIPDGKKQIITIPRLQKIPGNTMDIRFSACGEETTVSVKKPTIF